MTLSEMLSFTAAQYLDDRVVPVEGESDTLWSDELLVVFMNEAQRILCRRAWCIIDEGHAEAGIISLETDVAVYPIHKSVLRVFSATPNDQEWPLYHSVDAVLRTPRPYSDAPYDLNSLTLSAPGRPFAYTTDAGTRQIRIWRTPSATEDGLEIALKVARLPVTWLTVDDVDAEPEISEDYHFLLCTYAAGKALTQPLADGQNKTDGRLLLAEFDAAVKEARQDRQRAEMSYAPWSFDSATSTLGQGVG